MIKLIRQNAGLSSEMDQGDIKMNKAGYAEPALSCDTTLVTVVA